MDRINILGSPIDKLTMQQTLERISNAIQVGNKIDHIVVNAGKLVSMQTDLELHKSVVNADLINADGQAVVWASKFLGQPLPERVAGVDLMVNLVKIAADKGYKIFLLGAKEEVVSKVVDIYSKQYTPELIAGYRNGYFTKEEESAVAKQIADSGAQLLFVAITSPKKEIFLHQNKEILSNVNFTMGVGGTFDVIAGVTKRAPVWMQNSGLEWFYRLIQEPKRMWRRYLVGNTKFMLLVIKEKLNI